MSADERLAMENGIYVNIYMCTHKSMCYTWIMTATMIHTHI